MATGHFWVVGIVGALALCPVGGMAQEVVSSAHRLAEELRHVLTTKTFVARIHSGLFGKYVPSGNIDYITSDRFGYSSQTFSVSVGRFEEWPTPLSGAAYLLEEPTRAEITRLCEKLTCGNPQELGLVERICLQAELWTAFESLYLESIHPGQLLQRDQRRVTRLLWELVQGIRFCAVDAESLPAVSSSEECRRGLFGAKDFVEVYQLDEEMLHDNVSNYRRVNRVRFYDPTKRIGASSGVELLASLPAKELRLSSGSIAMLEEDALTITSDGQLRLTGVPLLLKSYRFQEAKPDGALQFGLARVKWEAGALDEKALEQFPPDAEAWGLSDLPNIPGNGVNMAFRAKLETVCASCHDGHPKALKPTVLELHAEYFRFDRHEQSYTGERNIRIKYASAEWRALAYYWGLSKDQVSTLLTEP